MSLGHAVGGGLVVAPVSLSAQYTVSLSGSPSSISPTVFDGSCQSDGRRNQKMCSRGHTGKQRGVLSATTGRTHAPPIRYWGNQFLEMRRERVRLQPSDPAEVERHLDQ